MIDKPKVSENVMKKAERLAQNGVEPYADGNYQVKGSKPNTSYYIQRLKDGTLSCECIAANNGNRNCAHIIAIGKYEEYQKELKKKKQELEKNPPVEKTTEQTITELEEAEF